MSDAMPQSGTAAADNHFASGDGSEDFLSIQG
jgi:hypothetical protein